MEATVRVMAEFGDSKFNELLANVESSAREPDCSSYTPEQTAIANKFFALLSSYLRRRCLQMARANQQAKDGFRLWFQMCRVFLPATGQRSLALAQTPRLQPEAVHDGEHLAVRAVAHAV